jgi:hypothetical protein
MEIKWEIKSWVPFISRFCPNDIHKIWKKGTSIRMDSTLVGAEGFSWIRGELSILFIGDGDDTGLYILRKDLQEGESYKSMKRSDVDDLQLEKDMSLLFDVNREISSIGPDLSSKFSIKPCKTWMGRAKTSKIENYDCDQYQIEGIKFHYKKREFRGENNTEIKNHSIGDEPLKTYEDYLERNQPLLYKHEGTSNLEKTFEGSVHLTNDFPIQLNQLVPIIEILSPSNRKYEYLLGIVNQIPENTFPVQLDIPIFPTVSAEVTFQNFTTNIEIEDSLFNVPDWFEENVQ